MTYTYKGRNIRNGKIYKNSFQNSLEKQFGYVITMNCQVVNACKSLNF